MHDVKSGNLRKIGFDDGKKVLYIGFWADKKKTPEMAPKWYQYENVTKSMFMDMIMNPYPGKTIMKTIVHQKEKYPFKPIKKK